MDHKVTLAMQTLKEEMQKDPHYAWTWHCSLAMMAFDAGADKDSANKHAATLMDNLFCVDTSQRNPKFAKYYPEDLKND